MIHFVNVSKYYGNHLIFDQVDCQIEMTSFNGLIDPYSTGKTTFFKLILRQEIPDGGQILFFRHSLHTLSKRALEQHRRQIGLIEQKPRFFQREDVESNIMLPLRIVGNPIAENAVKMHELAEQLDLLPLIKKTMGVLSTGERQLVSVARALIHEPVLILADDPTQHLSDESSKVVIGLLYEAYLKGTTVIVAARSSDQLPSDARIFGIRHYQIQDAARI